MKRQLMIFCAFAILVIACKKANTEAPADNSTNNNNNLPSGCFIKYMKSGTNITEAYEYTSSGKTSKVLDYDGGSPSGDYASYTYSGNSVEVKDQAGTLIEKWMLNASGYVTKAYIHHLQDTVTIEYDADGYMTSQTMNSANSHVISMVYTISNGNPVTATWVETFSGNTTTVIYSYEFGTELRKSYLAGGHNEEFGGSYAYYYSCDAFKGKLTKNLVSRIIRDVNSGSSMDTTSYTYEFNDKAAITKINTITSFGTTTKTFEYQCN